MADEATIRSTLTIQKDNVKYQSQPQGFQADIAASPARGPSPGALIIPTSGRDISFTELTQPSLCYVQNLEADGGNFFELGIKDPQTNVFYPLLEFQAGEGFVFRLSRNLQEQYAGSGTGTTGPENYLRLKANGGSVNAKIEAFEA